MSGPSDWLPRGEGRSTFEDDLQRRSVSDLVKELLAQTQVLFREEIRLARSETREEMKKVGKASGLLGAGGAILFAALLFFGVFLTALLSRGMAVWGAALIVTAIYAIGALTAISVGRAQIQKVKPNKTLKSVKEDGAWMRDTMQNIRSHRRASA